MSTKETSNLLAKLLSDLCSLVLSASNPARPLIDYNPRRRKESRLALVTQVWEKHPIKDCAIHDQIFVFISSL
jgi:hypothetical protein